MENSLYKYNKFKYKIYKELQKRKFPALRDKIIDPKVNPKANTPWIPLQQTFSQPTTLNNITFAQKVNEHASNGPAVTEKTIPDQNETNQSCKKIENTLSILMVSINNMLTLLTKLVEKLA